MLNGYEAQVFADIYEVEDAAFTTWARLNAETNGAFFDNPDEALQDMLFGSLYALFLDILNGNVSKPDISKLNSFAKEAARFLADSGQGTGNKQGTGDRGQGTVGADIADKNLPPTPYPLPPIINSCIDIYAHFDYSLFGNTEAKTKLKKTAAAGNAQRSKEAELYALGFSLLYMVETLGGGQGMDSGQWTGDRGQGTAGTGRKSSTNEDSNVSTDMADNNLSPIPYPLSPNTYPLPTEHLHLDRKLRQAYEAAGIDNNRAWRTVEIMKALLRRVDSGQWTVDSVRSGSKPNSNADSGVKTAITNKQLPTTHYPLPTIILDNLEAPDFRAILGVNVWEETVYFNKEAFEETVQTAPFLLSPFADTAALKKAQAALIKAAAKSEYKVTKLLEALEEG
jgi:hypothetical protein